MNDEPVPEKFMDHLRGENLAKDLYKDEIKVELIRKVEDVRIQNGKLILASK